MQNLATAFQQQPVQCSKAVEAGIRAAAATQELSPYGVAMLSSSVCQGVIAAAAPTAAEYVGVGRCRRSTSSAMRKFREQLQQPAVKLQLFELLITCLKLKATAGVQPVLEVCPYLLPTSPAWMMAYEHVWAVGRLSRRTEQSGAHDAVTLVNASGGSRTHSATSSKSAASSGDNEGQELWALLLARSLLLTGQALKAGAVDELKALSAQGAAVDTAAAAAGTACGTTTSSDAENELATGKFGVDACLMTVSWMLAHLSFLNFPAVAAAAAAEAGRTAAPSNKLNGRTQHQHTAARPSAAAV